MYQFWLSSRAPPQMNWTGLVAHVLAGPGCLVCFVHLLEPRYWKAKARVLQHRNWKSKARKARVLQHRAAQRLRRLFEVANASLPHKLRFGVRLRR